MSDESVHDSSEVSGFEDKRKVDICVGEKRGISYLLSSNEEQKEGIREEDIKYENLSSTSSALPNVNGVSSTILKCPMRLVNKRDLLFSNVAFKLRSKLVIDDVAVFSVTESGAAEQISSIISECCRRKCNLSTDDAIILDGMACVGGNTISFTKHFKTVLSNELDGKRFDILKHNVLNILNYGNVEFFNVSIIELSLSPPTPYDVLFLDPEWGGPEYLRAKNIRLSIGRESLEDFVLNVFRSHAGVKLIALKLPINYDNNYVKARTESEGIYYEFHSNITRMTLTLLTRS